MKEISAVDPTRLIVTDPPTKSSASTVYEQLKKDLLWNNVPPIVVVAQRILPLLILDGNCRAYLLAYSNQPINALVLTRDSDRDELLKLQQHRKIPSFPHHEYLMEKINLSQLKLHAFYHAKRYGILTVQGLLDMDDIDSIEPIAIPTPPETAACAAIHNRRNDVSKPKPVECLILYDRQGEHFLPIVPTRLKEARGYGYDCTKVTDLLKIQEGIAWARERWEQLDVTIHELVEVW